MCFEYLRTNIEVSEKTLVQQLNEFGNDEWELVSCFEKVIDNKDVIYDCIFKKYVELT